MATHPEPDNLDFEEQRVRIARAIGEVEKISAETRKLFTETRVIPMATVFQGLIAVAALLGAGAAIAKLFFP